MLVTSFLATAAGVPILVKLFHSALSDQRQAQIAGTEPGKGDLKEDLSFQVLTCYRPDPMEKFLRG